jgi:phytanoyl-CoA hydroxylase
MSATAPTYRSDFGGLWTDRSDVSEQIERRLAAGDITAAQAQQLRFWVENGYIVLEGAVPSEAIDRFRDDIARAFEQGDERLLIRTPENPHGYGPLRAGTSPVRARVVDPFAYNDAARDLLFAEPIVDWLRLVFEDDPLLFQSLSYDRGSEQGMHQDTAYVVVSSPLELAASWIALEDIRPGSGELMYYEGSHRLPEYKFSGRYKHWNPGRDGEEQHNEWARLLNENAEKRGMPRRTFLAKKGDVLIWSADLVHGRAPVDDDDLTRRSLVGHYCPRRVEPNWFTYREDRFAVVPWKGGWMASEHYDLSTDAQSTWAPGHEPASAEPEPGRAAAAATGVEPTPAPSSEPTAPAAPTRAATSGIESAPAPATSPPPATSGTEPAPPPPAPSRTEPAPARATQAAPPTAAPEQPRPAGTPARRRSGGLVGKLKQMLRRN